MAQTHCLCYTVPSTVLSNCSFKARQDGDGTHIMAARIPVYMGTVLSPSSMVKWTIGKVLERAWMDVVAKRDVCKPIQGISIRMM